MRAAGSPATSALSLDPCHARRQSAHIPSRCRASAQASLPCPTHCRATPHASRAPASSERPRAPGTRVPRCRRPSPSACLREMTSKPSYLASAHEHPVFVVHAHEYRKRDAVQQDARTTVAHERQRQTFGRQETEVHTHVDKG